MKIVTWRNAALVLAVICGYQRWQGCTPATPASATTAARELRLDDERAPLASTGAAAPLPRGSARAPAGDAPALPARSFYGVKLPAWAMLLAPQPGEKPRDYRDRILPVVQAAIAPQRARVARTRDDLALDAHQRAELDGAVQEAAAAIEDRVMNGVLGGELRPATFKPMTGIAVTRELLDIVDRGNTRFLDTLTPDQRTRLASHRFDFADYLVFSARWEDALHVLD